MDTLRFSHPDVRMVAHRGLSGLETENTASAFVAAGNRSYYGIETDVHRTGDGRFVVIHDFDTERVSGDHLEVEKTSLETLRSLRLHDSDGVRDRLDLRIPTLREYARICAKYEKVSVLELKSHFTEEEMLAMIEILRDVGQLARTTFISFHLENLVLLRRLLPEQSAQYLVEALTDEVMEALTKYDLDIDIYHRGLTADGAKRLKDAGRVINVWTVDHLEDAERMLSYGVDFITSNILE